MTGRTWAALVAVVALVAGACGGGGPGAGGGESRKVLVDYKHDQFSASFLAYFPTDVKVHPGDSVEFRQFWSGEPHSVTMGTLVDELGKPYWDILDPLRQGKINKLPDDEPEAPGFFEKLPFMADFEKDLEPIQAASQPCYLDEGVPDVSDNDKACPKRPQPAFNGRQSYYNSGFIPYQGQGGNSFKLPIADDAKPGTYHYYCNWHFVGMSGTVTVVPEDQEIPSQREVNKKAQAEARDYTGKLAKALSEIRSAKRNPLPVVGGALSPEDEKKEPLFEAFLDEFVPSTVNARVGEKVKWTFYGGHTLSFNVPKYFPVFKVGKDGKVAFEKLGFQPVKFPGPPEREEEGPPTDAPQKTADIDGGNFDGSGGLHSTGIEYRDGDTFSLTFTKPGTYLFACLVHPAMVGKVVVK